MLELLRLFIWQLTSEIFFGIDENNHLNIFNMTIFFLITPQKSIHINRLSFAWRKFFSIWISSASWSFELAPRMDQQSEFLLQSLFLVRNVKGFNSKFSFNEFHLTNKRFNFPLIPNDFFLVCFFFYKENVEKSSNSQNGSKGENDWMSYSYKSNSASNFSSRGSLSNQTSPWKRSTVSPCGSPSSTSESSWCSNDMDGMSRWPSSASFSSMCSTKSSKSHWSDTPTKTRSDGMSSSPSSSLSNSFDEQTKRRIYVSNSIFVDNLRANRLDDSFNSEFDKFYVNKKWFDSFLF